MQACKFHKNKCCLSVNGITTNLGCGFRRFHMKHISDISVKNDLFVILYRYITPYRDCFETNIRDCGEELLDQFDYHLGLRWEFLRVISAVELCRFDPCAGDPCMNGGECINLVRTIITFFFFNKKFLEDTCSFMGPLVPLSWISDDVSSGFQKPYLLFCGGEYNVHSMRSTSGVTPANLLTASITVSHFPTCIR